MAESKTQPNVGQQLKSARLKRGLSLDDVHAQIRIHPRTLSNLEENRFADLPAAIYTKGFLKHYGDFLDLNSGELLAIYDTLNVRHKAQSLVIESKDKAHLTSLFPDIKFSKSADWIRTNKKNVLVSIACVLLIAIIWTAVMMLWGRNAAPPGPIETPAPAAARLKLDNPTPAQERQRRLAQAARYSDYLNSVGQNNFPQIAHDTPLDLQIKTTTAVWIRLALDGEIVFESIMRPDQSRSWKANKLFDIQFGRPEGAILTLNKYHLGQPGGGKAKHVIINRKGMRSLK